MADLDKTLYVRADNALLAALDARLERERERRPGERLSRADLVRALLWGCLGSVPA